MSKLINFNTDYKNTTSSIRRSISNLQAQISTSIKQQAYIHKNPDNNINEDDLLAMQASFLNIVTEFNILCPMVEDMTALHVGSIDIDDMITKYNVNVDQYSAGLEDPVIDWE